MEPGSGAIAGDGGASRQAAARALRSSRGVRPKWLR
jgi:hypothetical protein